MDKLKTIFLCATVEIFLIVCVQKWLKNNAGKTYKEAIAAYYQILEDKQKKKAKIDRQFEYSTYIRDFFADNDGRFLEDAIKCWKYKKQLQGHNRYERADLIAIEKQCTSSCADGYSDIFFAPCL